MASTHGDFGTFDEESCRYFLREVGQRVVPSYPFSYGMEEAYSLMLEKYGPRGIGDALSLLHEFLEDDDLAAGVGDDGDIWRSWRFQWSRRNCDSLNPYIPRIGGFILPAPTPKHIRMLKAEAFLRLQEGEKPSVQGPTCQNIAAEVTPPERAIRDSAVAFQSADKCPGRTDAASGSKATYSHQRCRLGQPYSQNGLSHAQNVEHYDDYPPRQSTSLRITVNSQQGATYAASSLQNDGSHSSQVVPFQMASSLQDQIEEPTHQHGRLAQIQALPQNPSPPSRRSIQRNASPSQHSQMLDHPQSGLIRAVNRKSHRSRLSCSGDRLRDEDFNIVPNRPVSEEKLSATSDLQHRFNTTELLDYCTTPESERKAAHRNTTIIDGVLNTSSGGKDGTGEVPETPQKKARASKRFSKLLDWVPGQPKNNRRSWLQGVKSLFGTTRDSPLPTSEILTSTRHPSTIEANSSTPNECSTTQMRKTTEIPPPTPLANPRFFLDGACDDEQFSVPSPTAHLNKPLPLTPNEIVKSLSSRPRSNSHNFSRLPTHESPRASTISTSNTIHQEELVAMAGEASRFEAMKTGPSLYNTDRRYLHHIMSPQDQLRLSKKDDSHVSFTSIAQQNPFTEDIAPSIATLQGAGSSCNTTLPTSQSEPNLSCRNSGPPPSIPMFYNTQGIPESPPSSSPEPPAREDNPSVQPCPENPNTETVHVKPTKSTPKRSQSPMKRMFGFVKTKTPEPGPDKQATPHSSSRRLKQWTNKIRHGFLTADEEEMQREVHIETYMEGVANPVRGQVSTFPISLDPAHQARLQADIELMIIVSANRFLLREADAGRLNPATVAVTREAWEKRNLPQVLEYLYDQATQRALILANLDTLNFYGSGTPDPVGLNSALYSWGVLAREMSVRTFCAGDSVIRKWLNDARHVLELLGAPLITFLAFQDLEVKTLACIAQKQHRRLEEGKIADSSEQTGVVPRRDWSATSNYGLNHRRNVSDGSYKYRALPPGLEHLNLSPTPEATPKLRSSNSVKTRKPTGFTPPPLPNARHPILSSVGDGEPLDPIPTTPRSYHAKARRFQGNGESTPSRRGLRGDW